MYYVTDIIPWAAVWNHTVRGCIQPSDSATLFFVDCSGELCFPRSADDWHRQSYT